MNLMGPLFPDRCFSRGDKCESGVGCQSWFFTMQMALFKL